MLLANAPKRGAEDELHLNRGFGGAAISAFVAGSRALIASVLSIALVTVALHPFRGNVNTVVVALGYLSAVLVVAIRSETWVAVATALVAFAAFDFYFIPPFDTLEVASSGDGLALLSFAVVSVASSEAATLLRRRAQQAEYRERMATALSAFSALLLAQAGTGGLADSVRRDAARLLDATDCAILILEGQTLLPPAAGDGQEALMPDFVDIETARAVADGSRPPLVLDGQPRTLYLPLTVEDRRLGVLVAVGPLRECSPDQRELPATVQAVGRTLAIALDRARLTEEAAHLEALRQSNEFKTILLAAISHDLKTPIAAIKATVTGLLGAGAQWDEDSREAALRAVDDATDRLNRLVTNLLDLSRIEAGAIHPQLEWHDLHDLIGSALATAGTVLDERRISVNLPDDLPLVHVDFVLIAQVITNLLDNAARYIGKGGRIEIHASYTDSEVIVSVWDDGPGIAPADRARVFEKFYRASGASGSRPAGAGLGLAISSGLVERHGGRIWAEQSPLGGASISFSLPRYPGGLMPPEVSPDESDDSRRR